MWYGDRCLQRPRETTELNPDAQTRLDAAYHMACKARLHRTVPEAGYVAELTLEDDEPLSGETHYRVRVEQRNGQRAWSSPIWVRPS